MKKIFLVIVIPLLVSVCNVSNGQTFLGDEQYDSMTEHGLGIMLAYSNQQYQGTVGNFNSFGNGIWGEKNALHGFDMGMVLQGTFGYGFGVYVGMNFGFFMSSNNPTSRYGEATTEEAFDSYSEFTFEMPLHMQFKQPIGDIAAIGIHTGLSIDLSYLALFEDTRGYYSEYSVLGDGVNVFNLTYDFALFLELGSVRFDVQWSHGLNDHKREGFDRFIRNRFLAGMTFFLNFDD